MFAGKSYRLSGSFTVWEIIDCLSFLSAVTVDFVYLCFLLIGINSEIVDAHESCRPLMNFSLFIYLWYLQILAIIDLLLPNTYKNSPISNCVVLPNDLESLKRDLWKCLWNKIFIICIADGFFIAFDFKEIAFILSFKSYVFIVSKVI